MIKTKVEAEMMTFAYESLLIDVEINKQFSKDINLVLLSEEGLYIELFSINGRIALKGVNYQFTCLNEASERVAILDWTHRSALVYLKGKYRTEQSVFRFNKLMEG